MGDRWQIGAVVVAVALAVVYLVRTFFFGPSRKDCCDRPTSARSKKSRD